MSSVLAGPQRKKFLEIESQFLMMRKANVIRGKYSNISKFLQFYCPRRRSLHVPLLNLLLSRFGHR